MKVYIILKADYCEWSAEYGFATPVDIKFRKAHAEDVVNTLNEENPSEQYYYEEMPFSLRMIPSLTGEQIKVLNDVDVFNEGEQLNELIIMERIREIQELKKEVEKLKQSISTEKKYADQMSKRAAKAELELSNIRKAAKAERKKDKPQFLGFQDDAGEMYWMDWDSKNRVRSNAGVSILISDLRKQNGNLKPVYAAEQKEQG
jgi:hypothetical protein